MKMISNAHSNLKFSVGLATFFFTYRCMLLVCLLFVFIGLDNFAFLRILNSFFLFSFSTLYRIIVIFYLKHKVLGKDHIKIF